MCKESKRGQDLMHRKPRGSTRVGLRTQYLFQINPLLEVVRHWQAQVLALTWEPTRKGKENKLGTPIVPGMESESRKCK